MQCVLASPYLLDMTARTATFWSAGGSVFTHADLPKEGPLTAALSLRERATLTGLQHIRPGAETAALSA